MHAFITGATGFIGKHVIKQLIAQKWHVTALCRDLSSIQNYPTKGIHWKQGSLQDIESLRLAMPQSVDSVFHLAADSSTWRLHHRRQYQVNVNGTKNMAKVALEKKAIRFIHTSSLAVFGFHDQIVDEHSEMRGIDSPIAYYRSKYLAEEIIREYIRKGLDAVILNPAAVVGPYDKQNWIRLFESIQSNHLPGIPPGSKSFCYVEDVAKAHIQAFVHGQCGENYILSGPNTNLYEVCHWIYKRLNKLPPNRVLPSWVFKIIGQTLSLFSYFTRKEPSMSSEQALIVCTHVKASSVKAHRELQYRCTHSLEDMLEITYTWWKQQPEINQSYNLTKLHQPNHQHGDPDII
jgi:nucleoside-diphosphate-sugar epimerase